MCQDILWFSSLSSRLGESRWLAGAVPHHNRVLEEAVPSGFAVELTADVVYAARASCRGPSAA